MLSEIGYQQNNLMLYIINGFVKFKNCFMNMIFV